jgi:uncharacterized protein YdaU (DUF1376 family)
MTKDPAFLFYTSDFITGVSFLSMEERGQYITALCLLHQHGGFLPKEDVEIAVGKLSRRVMTKFIVGKDDVIHNKRLLDETIKRNAFCESRRKSRTSNIRRTHVKRMENENENEDVIVNKNVFIIPSVKDVEDYCKSRGNTIHAAAFIDFYTSKGWMIGKSKMKNWKAAIHTWEHSRKDEFKAKPTQAQINTMVSMEKFRKASHEQASV